MVTDTKIRLEEESGPALYLPPDDLWAVFRRLSAARPASTIPELRHDPLKIACRNRYVRIFVESFYTTRVDRPVAHVVEWSSCILLRKGAARPMGIMDFFKGELLEIIEWTDDSRDTLSWRFPDEDKAIKYGAQLIVRESQVAQFVYLGEFGDTFGPGKHSLVTDNIPILTRIQSWPYGFSSPFKADVYFVVTRLFTGNKWGTSNPVMLRDNDFGVVRVRAFGTYDFKIVDPKTFLREVAGSDHNFRLDEFADTMRSRIVSIFTDAIATAKIPVLDVASRYTELGEALLPLINPAIVAKYGLEIASFIVENVSAPVEVEQAIDKRSSMAAIGNLNDFVKYQMGKGFETGGGAGAAGAAAELAVGFGLAQQMARDGFLSGHAAPTVVVPPGTGAAAAAGSGLPELLAPAEAAQALGVSEADVIAVLETGELKGKKIGSSWRIPRAALTTYLSQ